VLRAVSTIHPGEEICISYLGDRDLKTQPWRWRRNALWESKRFICACTRCQVEAEAEAEAGAGADTPVAESVLSSQVCA
jgi:hypothetical protein